VRRYLLFSIVVIQMFRSKQSSLRRTDKPFTAVRVVARFADWVISDNVKHKVILAIVNQLVRLAWLEDKGIAGSDRRHPLAVAKLSGAGNDVVKLPLRALCE
jgi:hypothetical protein